eukprot:m.130835 g.130835  ORF g.130835 m.130835 type:complete len:74 (-) comp16802_c0_seq5:262-483(-)
MHPQLDLHLHPKCRDIISQLRECHAKSAVGKLMGNCNDIKVKMDDCLYQEQQPRSPPVVPAAELLGLAVSLAR